MLLRIFFCFYRQNSRRKAKDNWSLMMMRMLLITITIFNDINQQMSNVNVVESFSFFRCGPVSPSWIVLLITKFELLKCPGFIIFSRKMVKEYQSQPKSSSMILTANRYRFIHIIVFIWLIAGNLFNVNDARAWNTNTAAGVTVSSNNINNNNNQADVAGKFLHLINKKNR